jgi:predicted P-loop ATPase
VTPIAELQWAELQWADDGGPAELTDELPALHLVPTADSPGRALVASYFARGYRPVFWPGNGDAKGPTQKGWPQTVYTLADYREGCRVGLLLGTAVSSGRHLSDVDVDWAPGAAIAIHLLPPTEFVFGRASKPVSHCFYLTPEALVSIRYDDPTDKTCLIELRGTTKSGDVGLQTMVPPSTWSKEGKREPLVFKKLGDPTFSEVLNERVRLAAIGMLLAKHLGVNGFGHDVRLAWAGFLLRAGISTTDLIDMGEGMSVYCTNLEAPDVRVVVESTAQGLLVPGKHIQGGRSFAKLLGPNGKKIVTKINEWLGRDSDFIRDKAGVIVKDSQENIRRAVELYEVELSHNEFSDKPLMNGETLEDAPLADLWLSIDSEFRFRPSYTFFEKKIYSLARENPFHPVREYLDGLKWDGTPRIDRWLETYGGAQVSETEDTQAKTAQAKAARAYLRAISAIVLIAAVRRVRQPGCKYDEMVVFESAQGLNKSTALRVLCPNEDWFSDDLPLNVDSKQIIERTLGKWLIESSDLSGKRKADIEQLKATLSRQVDGPARLAYHHIPSERRRHFIVIGTTNSASYLNDPTGARRFWPVKVKKFDVDGIRRDRDQLWAEAAYREADGESIRLDETLWTAAGAEQEQRREVDAWEEVIAGELDRTQDDGTRPQLQLRGDGKKAVATDVLWEALGIEVARRDRTAALRISEVMQRLGYERTKVTVEKKLVRGYVEKQPSTPARETGGEQ